MYFEPKISIAESSEKITIRLECKIGQWMSSDLKLELVDEFESLTLVIRQQILETKTRLRSLVDYLLDTNINISELNKIKEKSFIYCKHLLVDAPEKYMIRHNSSVCECEYVLEKNQQGSGSEF